MAEVNSIEAPLAAAKPRLTYADFVACKVIPSANDEPTVGALIAMLIRDIDPIKKIGTSQMSALKRLQRSKIGAIIATKFSSAHLIQHCQDRQAEGVCPATVGQDVAYLRKPFGLAKVMWKIPVSIAPIKDAMPFLKSMNLVGKSTPRTRVPTDEEIEQLLAYFAIPPRRITKHTIMAMPDMMAFALASTRRVSEICRFTYGDINWQTMMYTVRDLKHPNKKKGNDKEFTLFPELAAIIKRQPRRDPNDPNERVFPFRPQSVSQKYTLAKKKLGIINLHFHDNRREAITRWLAIFSPHEVKLISGHETIHVLERVYDATDPVTLHAKFAKVMAAQAAAANEAPAELAKAA
jgi:integrase